MKLYPLGKIKRKSINYSGASSYCPKCKIKVDKEIYGSDTCKKCSSLLKQSKMVIKTQSGRPEWEN